MAFMQVGNAFNGAYGFLIRQGWLTAKSIPAQQQLLRYIRVHTMPEQVAC